MHLLLALGRGKLMVVYGSGTDTSLAACCPLFCGRRDPAPRTADLNPNWPWISSMISLSRVCTALQGLAVHLSHLPTFEAILFGDLQSLGIRDGGLHVGP